MSLRSSAPMQLGLVMRSVAQRDLDRLRALHHVIIRQDVPVGIDHESRAGAFHRHRIEEESYSTVRVTMLATAGAACL